MDDIAYLPTGEGLYGPAAAGVETRTGSLHTSALCQSNTHNTRVGLLARRHAAGSGLVSLPTVKSFFLTIERRIYTHVCDW